ncbi:Na/Pi symporter [Leptothoe spongobia]|uniref:Na/Pi symporter n=1 Tax=Leptothoe spongobia TAU-MAC 1115 TaxID=1967444 RepID=A0A947DIU0_9CYAN|nr:Na/Pi symporter [Leptothoe spongobia]MBT9317795.1 Na/Pi symporter [Leptothoe spongobia TAU-MAC 1115]
MVTPSSQSDSNPVVNTDTTDLDNTDSTATATEPVSTGMQSVTTDNSATSGTPGHPWPLYTGGILLAIYGLFASIDLLDIGFQAILGPQAEVLLTLASNPWLGLLLGILATALLQSSSIVTVLLVALVAGGLPIATAIPMVMGANLGTTITNTLVSLGYIGNDDDFERGFAAATIHDCFNLLALVIFFPLELLLHPLERLSQWFLTQNPGLDFLPEHLISPIGWLVQPTRWLIAYGVNHLNGPWDSLLLFGISVGGLMISVTSLGWLTKHWLSGPAQEAIYRGTGHGSKLGGLAVGAGVTALLQSSSMTTSLMVPLAGVGIVALDYVYPFVLGANIGTCITALLATLAVDSPVALQLALVHISYNLLAVALIYGLPLLRAVPLTMAQQLATIARHYRIVAIVYVVGVFFLLPFMALWLSLLLLT